VTGAIEASDTKSFTDNSVALLYFESNQTLEWIEKISHRINNVSLSWGVLSAASQFSWAVAYKWLELGRPLSLISLDALVFCTTTGERKAQTLWLIKHPPTLINPAPSNIIADTITQYLHKDNVPRTKAAVAQIIHSLF
jgi:hypothetical protein